jgi:hypothetical protein
MRKKDIILTFITAILVLAVCGAISFNSTTANPVLLVYFPKITINSDGSITPQTNYISRNGTIYTLTADIMEEYSIDILCSNIVFDGAGYTINVTTRDNSALILQRVTNVTVKNFEVFSRHNSIIFISCSNCLITGIKSVNNYISFDECNSNTVTKSSIKLGLLYSDTNKILMNNITGLSVDLCFHNNFFENNILCSYVPNPYFNSTNRWDNGSIGNYWMDYQSKYSNASQIDNTGIGNIPYVINSDNIDNYPLLYSFDIEKGIIAFPAETNTQKTEPSSTIAIIGVASIIAITVSLSVGLLLHRRQRKNC